MDDRTFERIGAISAAAVAALSLLYAVAYLGITPSDQRGADADAFFRSYLAHPAGLRLASVCLLVSGPLVGVAVVALAGRLTPKGGSSLTWAVVAGVAVGFATSAHGLDDLLRTDQLARRYRSGSAATRAAVIVAHQGPSAVDPRGLFTFGVAGLVVAVLALAIRRRAAMLGRLGLILGADMVALFVATAAGVQAAVLVTGGLASVLLGPAWWLGVARLLTASPDGRDPVRATAADVPPVHHPLTSAPI